MPWGKDYEGELAGLLVRPGPLELTGPIDLAAVPEFKRPDFTSLEIISFATGGIPAGINIPNCTSIAEEPGLAQLSWPPDVPLPADHDVRERDGFKNVSLQNILSAKSANDPTTFIAPEEVEQYKIWEDRAFSVQVANHELLGHGTGRLFQEQADGTRNFDADKTINPLTGKPITSWYKPGESESKWEPQLCFGVRHLTSHARSAYGSRIGPVAPSMEECRAESVALYLASNRDIASIFGLTSQEDQDDLTYYTFAVMARAGVRGLEFFDPSTRNHGQAHMEARLGITNWMFDHGLGKIEYIENDKGELVDAFIRLDRTAVLEKGKDVMGKLLVELQVRVGSRFIGLAQCARG